jgi:hypothetical protein
VPRSMRGRLRSAAVLVVAVAPALAAPSLAQQSESRDGPVEAVRSDEAARRVSEDRERRLEERRSPEARQARERSRGAHRGLGRSEALALAKDRFGAIILRAPWQPLRLEDGQRVERYLGERSARLTTGERTALVDSSLPLRSTVATGEPQPVDLAVGERADSFAPRNPLVAAVVSKRVADGIRFPAAGYGLRLEGALGLEQPVVVEDKLFFANAAADTDLIVAPTPTGLEVSLQVRSAGSPEQYPLAFDLAPGMTLRTTSEPPGAAEIVRGDERIALITPPKAFDAEQFPVPVAYEVRGSTLVVAVRHRSEDLLYPLYVDPVVDNYRLDGAGNRVYVDDAFAAWDFTRNHAAIYNSRNGRYGNGLYVYTQPNNYYAEANYGYWFWTAPRQSYIERVDFGYVSHTHNYQGSCVMEGIYAPSAGRYDEGHWAHPPGYLQPDRYPSSPWNAYTSPAGEQSNRNACWDLSGNYKSHHPSRYGPTPGNQVIYGMSMVSNFTRSYESLTYMFGASMHLNDSDVPRFTSAAPSSSNGWIDDGSAKHTLTPAATDAGLGMWAFGLFIPGSAVETQFVNSAGTSAGTSPGCDGTHVKPCPRDASVSYSYTLPEGDNLVTIEAYDVLGKGAGGQQWRMKIDRLPPRLQITGPLRESQYVDGSDSMTVTATDGVAGGAEKDRRSGVRSVEIKVDTRTADYYEDPCNPECPATVTRTFTLDPEVYDQGPHTIEVITRDRLGHPSSDSWTVNSDALDPVVTLDGPVYDADEGVLPAGSHTLAIDAVDGDANSGESGVESIEVQVENERKLFQSQTCSAGNCDMVRSWTLDTNAYEPGDYTITVIVTDTAGNVSEQELSVALDHDPALSSQTIQAASVAVRTDGGAGERAGTSVASVGDINGDALDDVVIGAPRASHNGRSTSGSAYVVLGRSSGVTDLSDASAAAFRIDGPQALARAGASVAAAGDVNGDGVGDILVGAPFADRPEDGGAAPLLRGAAYVVFGSAQLENVDLANLGSRGFRIDGPVVGGLGGVAERHALPFGYALAGRPGGLFDPPGDINGDGRDDVVVGAPTEGANLRSGSGSAFVVFGKPDTAAVNVSALGQGGFRIDGAAAGERAGFAVGVAGDIDNDGRADVLIGAPAADPFGRQDAGAMHVVYGKADGTPVDLAASGCRCYRTSGAAAGDQLGFSLAALGDDDGDELDDFAVGGRTAYLLYGQGAPSAVDLAGVYGGYALRPPAEAAGEPALVSPGGDINSDLTRDILIAYPSGSEGRGVLYAFFGFRLQTADVALGSLGAERGARLAGTTPGDRFGSSATALDNLTLEQPGLVVGAPGAENDSQTDSGSAYVVSDEAFAVVGGFNPASGAPIASARRTRRQRCRRAGTVGQPNSSGNYSFARPSDHAFCRRTHAGRTEMTQLRGLRNSQGRVVRRVPRGRINLPVRGTRHLKTNSNVGGRRYHDLFDSFGAKIGSIEQLSNGQYRLYNQDGSVYGTTRRRRDGYRPRLVVQGEGCVVPVSARDTYVIVYVLVRGSGVDQQGQSVDMAFRGFLPRAALPDGSLLRGRSNHAVIEDAPAACGRRAEYRNPASATGTIASPGFDGETQKYQGSIHTARHSTCRRLTNTTRHPDCGRRLSDYNVRDAYPSVLPLVATTTGVRGGGIIAGLVRVPNASVAGSQTRELDHIRYLDPNVPCTRRRVAQWFRVDGAPTQSQPVIGWYAHRVPNGPQRGAGC